MSTSDVLGYPVSARGCAGDVARAMALLRAGGRGHYVACANPHSLLAARADTAFDAALRQADVLLPDGTGVVMAARLLGQPVPERVAGYEFFMGVNAVAQQAGLKYFFLGSSEAVLARMAARMASEYPAILVVGTLSPPFKPHFDEADDRGMVAAINAARPDIVWVGMTAPKQEKWILANRARLEVPLLCAVGAVFDFYAGTKKRAGPLWRGLGLEWLPRLLREPRRLFRRNFESTPRFLWWVACERLARRPCRHRTSG